MLQRESVVRVPAPVRRWRLPRADVLRLGHGARRHPAEQFRRRRVSRGARGGVQRSRQRLAGRRVQSNPSASHNPARCSNPSVLGGAWRRNNAEDGNAARTRSATAALAAIMSSATTRIIGTSPLVNTSEGAPSAVVSNRSSAEASSTAPARVRASRRAAANADTTATSAATRGLVRREGILGRGGGAPSAMACAW